MKCPACGYENPPETRYCLRCGKALVPPVPQAAPPVRPVHRISKGLVAVLCLIGAMTMVILIGIALSLPFHAYVGSTRAVASSVEAADENAKLFDALDYPIFSSEEDQKYFGQFINRDARTLRLPESEITMELPEMIDFHFSYDDMPGMLLMEFTTPDDLSVSITSSTMDTTPYTRDVAEENEKSGLYRNIEGTQTQYYYQLAPRQESAGQDSVLVTTAVLVDCKSSRSTTILVSQPIEHDGQQSEELLDTMLESTGLAKTKE